MQRSLRGHYADTLTSASHLGLLAIGVQAGEKTIWMGCLALIALISFFAWASGYKRARAIADTPTSRIASAAQGYVELFGTATLGTNLIASPLSGTRCVWFRYWIYTKSGNKWQQSGCGISHSTFEITDSTGTCHIDPDDAEVLAPERRTSYQGQYKHVEELLYAGRVYALGEFSTIGGASSTLDMKQDVSALLSEWKRNSTVLHERFDLDKNGQIDMQEWELARRAAVREVQKEHREIRAENGVHVMRAPRDGRLFLLSNLSPQKLRNRYLWWSLFHLSVFIMAVGAIFWLWQDHYLQALFG
jgi:hypothetical protein